MKKELYFAPEIKEHEIISEGFLCSSDEDGGADAGFFEENEW